MTTEATSGHSDRKKIEVFSPDRRGTDAGMNSPPSLARPCKTASRRETGGVTQLAQGHPGRRVVEMALDTGLRRGVDPLRARRAERAADRQAPFRLEVRMLEGHTHLSAVTEAFRLGVPWLLGADLAASGE